MTKCKETLDPRRAGQVERYHTWPKTRVQSVAEHSWGVARLVLAIWPEAPRHLLVSALLHDVGEVATGDLPYPTKANSPTLKAGFDALENDAHLAMTLPWQLPSPPKLAGGETAVLKAADYLEMWEWALDELQLGNANANLVRERCELAVADVRDRLMDDVRERLDNYMARRAAQHERIMRRN